jgi:hypothetical protein
MRSKLPPTHAETELDLEQRLPSGRCVLIRPADDGEELEVRSPEGEVEVRILLTAQGPVLRLRGVRLELEAEQTVAVRCGRFEVRAEGNVDLQGAQIRLNSPEEE